MKFLKRWQDMAWLLVLGVLAYLAWRIIPAIDPRSGIDGFGDLFNALIMGIKGVMATILAWLCKQLYWYEPDGLVDRRWHETVELPAQPPADGALPSSTRRRWVFALIVKDRAEYLIWLAFWAFVFF